MQASLRTRVVTAMALVSALWSASALRAQESNGGTWGEMALGYGSAQGYCGTCSGGRHEGYSFQLGGGVVRPHFHVGLVLDVWQHVFPDADTRTAMTTVTASAQYYPRVRGLFLEGGLGFSDYRMLKGLHGGLLFEHADTTYFSGLGLEGTLGLGYDFRISHWIALSPRVAYVHGAPRTLHSPSGATVATGSMQNVFEATVAFVAHTPD